MAATAHRKVPSKKKKKMVSTQATHLFNAEDEELLFQNLKHSELAFSLTHIDTF